MIPPKLNFQLLSTHCRLVQFAFRRHIWAINTCALRQVQAPTQNLKPRTNYCMYREAKNPQREREKEKETMDGMSNMVDKSYSHMTFFWGRNSEILFAGWPGARTGMYVVALVFVFVLALLVECLSRCMLIGDGLKSNRIATAVLQTLVHATRVGLAYLLMLAVMSFNVGVLIVAILGHGVGFFFFGSRAFKKTPPPEKASTDLPPMNC